MMAETCEITLTEENWQKVDELFTKFPYSEFLRLCVMNEIVEEGLKQFESEFVP